MQIFHHSSNVIAKLSILGLVVVGGFLAWLIWTLLGDSPYVTKQGEILNQPVPFSHDHHVGGLGIDCRYCHTSVEKSASAGMPSTETCINCHKQIWTNADLLEPVRASFRDNVPIKWARVHDLPDYVYFNHSVHIAKGIGCISCHGQVDRMPLMRQQASLQMQWCLDCHRDPGKNVRPREEVFNLQWQPPSDPREAKLLQAKLVKEYNVKSLTSCSTCHR
jgi:hypothetical protein